MPLAPGLPGWLHLSFWEERGPGLPEAGVPCQYWATEKLIDLMFQLSFRAPQQAWSLTSTEGEYQGDLKQTGGGPT